MNPYEELNVSPDDSDAEIKKAYKREAHGSHPDKEGGDSEKFHQITKAYNAIKNADAREEYERTGSTDTAPKADPVMSKVADLFSQIIESEQWSGNIVEKAVVVVDDAIFNQNNSLQICDNKLKKLESQLGRVITDGGTNLYEGVIVQKVAMIKSQIEMLKGNVSLMNKVLEHLETYTDDCVEPEYTKTDMVYTRF